MKKIILFLVLSLLTGCSLNYELKINKDLSVIETINVIEPRSKITMYVQDVDEYIQENIDNFSSQEEYNIYNIYDGSNETRAIGIATVDYNNFNDYCETNTINDYFFSDCKVYENENIITINLESSTANDLFVSTDLEEALFTSASISIIIPFKVVSNNADSIDLESSTYTWKYTTEDYLKDISITYNTTEENVKPVNYSMYIIGGIILVVIISGIVIYTKYKQNSKF